MPGSGERAELVLGLDIGGTKTAYVLGNTHGEILARQREPTAPSGDPDADIARIAGEARRFVEAQGVSLRSLAAAGISVPGPFDADSGVLLRPPNLPGWDAVPVRYALVQALGCPVLLENDANAAVLAETRWGAGVGARHVVYLTMSTGVGAGLVLDGCLYRGAGEAAGEIGHAPVEWNGEPCSCGMRGCLEAYVGGAAWGERLRALAPEDSLALALAGKREALQPEHVVAAAREGCAFSCGELERYVEYLARGIVQLAFVLAPERIVLGTIPTAAGEALCFAPLRARVSQRLWPSFDARLSIVPSGLGDELPYRAGLCVALEALESLL